MVTLKLGLNGSAGGHEVSSAVDNMKDLEQRISSLRQLLNGEAASPPAAEPESVAMFQGHAPAHAAPGPLLDELQTPQAAGQLEVVKSEIGNDAPAVHQPEHARLPESDEFASLEASEVVRLQA